MHSMDWIKSKKKIKNKMEWAQILISIYKANSFQIYHKNKLINFIFNNKCNFKEINNNFWL